MNYRRFVIDRVVKDRPPAEVLPEISTTFRRRHAG